MIRFEPLRPRIPLLSLTTVTRVLTVLVVLAAAAGASAQVQVYTDEASYLTALSNAGYLQLVEGFEGSAWDVVRSTIGGGTVTAPSVTSQGITWTTSTEITTNNLFPHSGTWRGYDHPGGAPDALYGASTTTLYGIGGWFTTSTLPASVRVFIDGVSPDNANLIMSTDYQFIGVISTSGFTTFGLVGDGTVGDEKHWFADDFTFGVLTQPSNNPPNGTITSPPGDVTIVAGGAVSFAGSVTDPDGDPVTVLWDFGDGTSSTVLNPGNHSYPSVGVFNVTFTATDSHGLADPTPDTRTITALAPGGITVSPTSGLVTTEGGGSAAFTVVLTSQPTASVTVGLSSSDTTEGTVSPASVVFNAGNWSTPQTVTVTGVDDAVVDGDIAYTVVTAAAVSSDPAYSGLDPADVSATNQDNDTAGILVSPTAGLVTNEAGGSATFTVVLTSQPTASVMVGLSSSDTTEGTVSPASVVFGAGNWSTPQIVTVTGVDDPVVDGDIAFTVVTAAAISSDAAYSGFDPADVSATNLDDDAAGILVSPTAGLVTNEAGGGATFTVVLTSQPTASVTVGLSSSDTTEGTVSPASVVFGAGNWSTPQTVTVTGVDDPVVDGDIAYTVVTAAAVSSDAAYSGLDPADVSATNLDDDAAGILVSPTAGLVTTEAGGNATFTVVLTTQPTADVTLGLSSSDTTEGTVSPASVVFSAGNWSTPQTVTVTGVDDAVVDGDAAYTIVTAAAVSSDPGYAGLDPADVSATNLDDDAAGILVSPTAGLVTNEAGGSAAFTVVLTSQPTASVTVGLSSSNTTEGTVSPGSVVFTSGSWSTPQTVTVTGVDDAVVDGDVAYTIVTAAAVSSDPGYAGLDPADVSVTNQDNDSAGILVSPTTGLVTTEAGGSATFTVVLTSQPTADVTVGLSSSDTTEGTVSPATVIFTPGSWSTPQTVTVTGIDDSMADGDRAYTVVTAAAVSGDPAFTGLNPADVSATNQDNDTASIVVDPVVGLVTTESGGTATFTVVLTSRPTGDVTVALSSSDATEGAVSPASVIFTPDSWGGKQAVTVTGVDDAVVDGSVTYTVVTGQAVSADLSYAGLNPADVSVTNEDNDAAGIAVNPTAGLVTTEFGGTASFTVVLLTAPTAEVTIGLSSSDAGEGTVAPASLTFTAETWSAPQAVTVTGVSDGIADGDVGYSIVTAPAVSADPAYNGLDAADVSVTNTGNQPPEGVILTPAADMRIQAGESVPFSGQASDPDGDAVTVLWSFGDGTTSTALSPGDHRYESSGTFTATLTVTDSHGLADPTPPSRTITVSSASVPRITGAVSGVAAVHGLQGSDWHTDLWIHNSGADPATVNLYYVANRGIPQLEAPFTLTVSPNQTRAVRDLLVTAFGLQGTSGALLYEVTSGDPDALILRADTYNRIDDRERYGQNVPGIAIASIPPEGTPLYLPGPPDSVQYRYNLGLQSAGAHSVQVRILDGSEGYILDTTTVSLQQFGWVQVVDLQHTYALGDASGWYIEVVGLDGPVMASGSLVDQRSNDGINIIAQPVVANGGSLWLPGGALLKGFLGSNWHSDLFSINPGGQANHADLSFFSRGAAYPDGTGEVSAALDFGAFQHQISGDVLATLLALPDGSVGTLGMVQDGLLPILHLLRTYNETEGPQGQRLTYGSAMPAMPLEACIGAGEEGRIVGITNDADTRANLSLTNTHLASDGRRLSTTVEIELLDADGSAIIQDSRVLEPYQSIQINKFPEQYLGSSVEVRDATLVVRVRDFNPGDLGGVLPIAYIVNGNRTAGVGTSDPQTVIAVKRPRVLP